MTICQYRHHIILIIYNLFKNKEETLMINQSKSKISFITFAAMIFAIFGFATIAQSSTSPFAQNDIDNSAQLVKGEKKKCGEGKCGDKKAEKKCGEGKCGDKKAEKKCGEGKCG